jgi:hypothetical protein
MAKLVGFSQASEVGDEKQRQGQELAAEMLKVGAVKNFPTLSPSLDKKLAASSQVEVQAQALKGQLRILRVLPQVRSEEWQRLANGSEEDKATAKLILDKLLTQSDNAANQFIKGLLTEQAQAHQELDLSLHPEVQKLFDIPPITTAPEADQTTGGLFGRP